MIDCCFNDNGNKNTVLEIIPDLEKKEIIVEFSSIEETN